MKLKFTIVIFFCFSFIFIEAVRSGLVGHGTAPILHARDLFGNSGNYIESHMNEIVWGKDTNGICVGLMSGNPSNNSLDTKREVIGVFHKNNTTNTLWFVVPQIPFQFDLAVFDERGDPVTRTWNGRDIGKAIPKLKEFTQKQMVNYEWDEQSNAREYLYPNNVELFTSVNLLDYFKLTKPGKYRVEYEQRFQIDMVRSNQLPALIGLVGPKAVISIEVH